MKKLITLIESSLIVIATGCSSTHVSVSSVHRENLKSQAKVLAISARNLEDSVHRHRADASTEAAARAVFRFHTEAETFARNTGGMWNEDRVNSQYERMIETWVDMELTFRDLKADRLTQEAYNRVAEEWERTHRRAGYAGQKYEREYREKMLEDQ